MWQSSSVSRSIYPLLDQKDPKKLPFAKTLIIIPTFNERENIEVLVRALFGPWPELSVLIVDDGSPDRTADVVKVLQKDFPRLHLIQRPGKLGLGTAYVEGLKFALKNKFDFIFEMDGDLSHSPFDIPLLLEKAQEADLVVGSRYLGGEKRVVNWPKRRLFLSTFAAWYTRFFTGMPCTDGMSGFKCFKRSALEGLSLENVFSGGYSFQMELNYRLWSQGKKLVEVPITFMERNKGRSKMGPKVIWEAIWAVFRLRLRRLFGQLD